MASIFFIFPLFIYISAYIEKGYTEIVSACGQTGCGMLYFLKQTSLASRKLKIIASTHFSDESKKSISS